MPGAGLERAEVEAKRVAEVEVDVRATRQPLREVRLERAVELDGVDARDALGEVLREDAQPGTDLEHDVVLVELGEAPDHAEDVLVDEEVLAEIAVRRDGEAHGSEKAAVAFESIWAPSSSASSPRSFGECGDRQHDVRGLVRTAAAGLGSEVRAVRLGEDPLRGHLRRRDRRSFAFGYVTLPANET